MTKPLIGITPLWDEEQKSFWMLPGYLEGILRSGGIPVIVPMNAERNVIAQVAEAMDGFLFTGGSDICPSMYAEEVAPLCGEVLESRDEAEAALFFEAVQKRFKPALGICRGLQLFNVLLGGTLYQDLSQRSGTLNHKQQPPYDKPVHGVLIDKEERLYQILKAEEMQVNSRHHQGVKNLADGLKGLAWAEDGVVEAIGMKGRDDVIAVQWHPELLPEEEASQRLFAFLIEVAGRTKK